MKLDGKLLSIIAHLLVPGKRGWAIRKMQEEGLLDDHSSRALAEELDHVAYGYRHSGLRLAKAKLFLDQHVAQNDFCFLNPNRSLNHLKERLKAAPGKILNGAHIVDYGCGAHNPFSQAAILLANGARQVTCIEPSIISRSLSIAAVMQTVIAIFTDPDAFLLEGGSGDQMRERLAGVDWKRLLSDGGSGPVKLLNSLGEISEKFDLMISTSVLEHLKEPEREFDLMNTWMNRDGVAVHSVDFTDHRHTDPDYHPFKFYFDGMHKDINGLRVSQLDRLLRDAGLFTTLSRVLEHDEDLNRAKLVPRYSDLSDQDLHTRGATFTLRKI